MSINAQDKFETGAYEVEVTHDLNNYIDKLFEMYQDGEKTAREMANAFAAVSAVHEHLFFNGPGH